MNLEIRVFIYLLWSVLSSAYAADKWSRQVESTDTQPETFDWVPVAQSVSAKDRAGRVITYQQNFPSNGEFGEFSKNHYSSPPQPAQPFAFPFHFQRFPQSQAQPLSSQSLQSQIRQQPSIQPSKANIQTQQPTSQSFFKFEMPYNREGNRNQDNNQGVQTGYQIQHSAFGGIQPLFQSTLFNQKQVFPPEFHPVQRPQHGFLQQQHKPIQQNFINEQTKQPFQESIQTESNSVSTAAPTPSFPLQQGFVEIQKPASFQSQLPYQVPVTSAPLSNTGTQQDQEVQLLYVPYDTLFSQQRNENPITDNSKYNSVPSVQHVSPYQINNFYNSDIPHSQDSNSFTTSSTSRPSSTSFKPSATYEGFLDQQLSTAKTKLKAHQPPLAMFLLKSTSHPTKIDVINTLKDAKTIAVLDAPTTQAPTIFVGPANMQIPVGYVKFELPYLSQLTPNGNLAEIPFFVAPLSYRTPVGFNKILLPEPHVGSIVINLQKGTRNEQFNTVQTISSQSNTEMYGNTKYSNQNSFLPGNELYNNIKNDNNQMSGQTSLPPLYQSQNEFISNTKNSNKGSSNQNVFITPSQNDKKLFSTSTPRIRPETTQRHRVHESQKLERGRFPYDTTTQKHHPTPNRGHKYSEISIQNNFNSEAIQEVTSPKIYKKRPDLPDNTKTYSQFKPIPNNIPAEDFFKVQPIRTNIQTTSTTPTTPTVITSSAPQRTYFTKAYPTRPQIDFQSTRGQLYHGNENFENTPPTRPSTQHHKIESQVLNEEYRMKQYFRQQEAFRNRSPFSTTTVRPNIENVPYTPVSVDYDHEVRIPSSTPTYYTSTTPKSTGRQRITFYHPTPTTPLYEENNNSVNPTQKIFEYSRDHSAASIPPQQEMFTEPPRNTQIPDLPQNKTSNDVSVQDITELEYEPNPYQLPSELPPLTPNLPGLVNGLVEKDKITGVDAETTMQIETTTKPAFTVKPTRRPINRTRKPVVSKVSQSVSYSSSDYSTRRPINRTRRPYTGRHNTTIPTSTTERTSNSRTPIIRNPNRIRYNPTHEERETLRIKTRKHSGNGKKEDKSDDLEYQRDVLKQNYPVFRPSTKKTTTITPPTSTEKPTSETQQIYTVTPSTEQQFNGLVEQMQIAQQYQEYPQNNYGPGYFPNEEELQPTEANLRNEIHSIYSSSSSTELPPQPTTRRVPFIRRGLRTKTTTESNVATTTPLTTTDEQETQARVKSQGRKVVKVRARTRRPHPASSTSTTEFVDEATPQPEKNNYNRLNRFNQDLYQDELAQRRQRIKSQFHLEPQESQWSPSLSGKSKNSFQPLVPTEKQYSTTQVANEPEIVTASPENEKSDSYTFNVSASLEPKVNLTPMVTSTESGETASKKSDKTFAALLEEVMSDIGKEQNLKSNKGSYFESQKTDSRLNRRNKWMNSNAGESFETAESQNIGTQFFNSLYTGTIEKATESLAKLDDMYATTATNKPADTINISTDSFETEANYDESTVASIPGNDVTTQVPEEQPSLKSFEHTQSDKQPESITSRMDELWNVEDLDSQASMFSEVRKQLNELFTNEKGDKDNENDVNNNMMVHRPEYTNIQRVRTSAEASVPSNATTVEAVHDKNADKFHKSLMESVVYATSTSTKEQTSETEICYRGHCIRSEDLPPNHKLH